MEFLGFRQVTEESFLVVKPDDISSSDFVVFIGELVNKYDQDAALYSNGREYFLIDQSGDLKKIGDKIALDKINQAYSTMKGKSSIPFVFEGLRNATSISSARILKEFGITTQIGYWNTDRELKESIARLEAAKRKRDKCLAKGIPVDEILEKIEKLEKMVESF